MNLPRVKTKTKKRTGRGMGSGKGSHTTGRGQKGQKSRGKIGLLFEGVKMKKSLIKRLPLARGKGKFLPKGKPVIVKIKYLDLLPAGSTINVDLLVKEGIVDKEAAGVFGVKILGGGEVKKKFSIDLPISKSAARTIEKAGGKMV